MKIFWIILFFMPGSLLIAQQQNKKIEKAYYWVTFTDKKESPYSIEQPEAYLGQRALARRAQFGIPITEEDLPVNPQYLEELKKLGIKIHHSSRWFNAATVIATPKQVPLIKDFPFVSKVKFVGKHISRLPRLYKPRPLDTLVTPIDSLRYYGRGSFQIESLNGHKLHERGFRGEGKLIAVLDGGFFQLDSLPFFDSLRIRNKILASRDFVEGDSLAVEGSAHGTKVLSTMGANIPGLLVGTAPGAEYLCLKTEDTRAEYLVEVCNWVAGIEYADSVGSDIVTSSLGYSQFTSKEMNYRYKDLDGGSTLAALAADKGFKKGMIILNSAGNEGHTKWKHINSPADAYNILSVGAVDKNLERAYFSSLGPTPDGRIKPEIVALGLRVSVASPNALQTSIENGTSLSAPIISGLVASLWQAFPQKSNKEIIQAVLKSASQYDNPDNQLGYGIPDFEKAFLMLEEN